MSYLIFCSFEVGGLPYKIAETLNRNGIETYYVSMAKNASGHDSTEFHYGKKREHWDLSSLFNGFRWMSMKDIRLLLYIKSHFGITYSLATGHKVHLLRQAGIKYGYWCYGSDLDYYSKSPFLPLKSSLIKNRSILDTISLTISTYRLMAYQFFPVKYPFWKKVLLYPYSLLHFCWEQRKSIVSTDCLMISPYQLKAYQELCSDKRLFFLPHLINVIDYEGLCKKKAESKKNVHGKIGVEKFFFSSTRHLWSGKNSSFADYKGNDVIFYSFAHYLKISGDKSSKLILVRKGSDIENSRELIQRLDIHNYVVWVDEMRRDELWDYYQGASVCFGQFGRPVLTYTALEPLSMATPTVSFAGHNNTAVPFYNTMPPIFNSKDPKDIANFMYRIITDTDYARDTSYNSWFWAKGNCSEERFVEAFLESSKRCVV